MSTGLHIDPRDALAPPPAPAPSAGAAAIGDQVRDARERGIALRVAGAGTWLDAGRPVKHRRVVEPLGLRELAGIVEYVPGDLTLTARAGTSLAEIAEVTAVNGQWLALDPYGSDAGTIGATVATGSSGPLATGFGTVRDAVLGVEFVTGTGAAVRGGGRVVKNVAGFDLVRLVTGAWGTLGVLTEVTVRLRARAAVDETLAVRLDERRIAAVAAAFRDLPFVPWAAELLSGTMASALALDDAPLLLVRVGGSRAAVDAQRAAIASLGAVAPEVLGHDVWQRLRRADAGAPIVMRISSLPSRIADSWTAAAQLAVALPGARAHASPLRGVVRLIAPVPDAPAPAVAAAIAEITRPALELRRVFERLPHELWPALAVSAVDDRLSRRLRETFDPDGILNPGTLGS